MLKEEATRLRGFSISVNSVFAVYDSASPAFAIG